MAIGIMAGERTVAAVMTFLFYSLAGPFVLAVIARARITYSMVSGCVFFPDGSSCVISRR